MRHLLPAFGEKEERRVVIWKHLTPRSSLQQKTTVHAPLIRRNAAPSPRVRGEGRTEGSYLEANRCRIVIDSVYCRQSAGL